MTTTYTKPLPDVNDEATAPFWAGTREGRLLVQKCDNCAYLRWPPGPICPECQSADSAWVDVKPVGRLWSVAVYHRPFDREFAADVPYSVGLVELDEGPRMYGLMIGEPESFVLDAPVHAVFESVTPEVAFVRWQH
jgi:uncharacterized protein